MKYRILDPQDYWFPDWESAYGIGREIHGIVQLTIYKANGEKNGTFANPTPFLRSSVEVIDEEKI